MPENKTKAQRLGPFLWQFAERYWEREGGTDALYMLIDFLREVKDNITYADYLELKQYCTHVVVGNIVMDTVILFSNYLEDLLEEN